MLEVSAQANSRLSKTQYNALENNHPQTLGVNSIGLPLHQPESKKSRQNYLRQLEEAIGAYKKEIQDAKQDHVVLNQIYMLELGKNAKRIQLINIAKRLLTKIMGTSESENIVEEEEEKHMMLCHQCSAFDEFQQIQQLLRQDIFTSPEVVPDQAQCLQKSKKFTEYSSLNFIGHVSPVSQGEKSLIHEFSAIKLEEASLELEDDVEDVKQLNASSISMDNPLAAKPDIIKPDPYALKSEITCSDKDGDEADLTETSEEESQQSEQEDKEQQVEYADNVNDNLQELDSKRQSDT